MKVTHSFTEQEKEEMRKVALSVLGIAEIAPVGAGEERIHPKKAVSLSRKQWHKKRIRSTKNSINLLEKKRSRLFLFVILTVGIICLVLIFMFFQAYQGVFKGL